MKAAAEEVGMNSSERQGIEPEFPFNPSQLPDEKMAELRRLAIELRAPIQAQGSAPGQTATSRNLVLLTGPSGTGKTMAAEMLARELGVDVIRVDASELVSKYIGETEKNLSAVLERPAGGGAILFFDEADALFGKRSEVKDSHDRYANIEVNYLLQRVGDYPGVVILSCNQTPDIQGAGALLELEIQ